MTLVEDSFRFLFLDEHFSDGKAIYLPGSHFDTLFT